MKKWYVRMCCDCGVAYVHFSTCSHFYSELFAPVMQTTEQMCHLVMVTWLMRSVPFRQICIVDDEENDWVMYCLCVCGDAYVRCTVRVFVRSYSLW